MIKKPTTIKNDSLEFLGQGTFRYRFADLFCRSLICSGFIFSE